MASFPDRADTDEMARQSSGTLEETGADPRVPTLSQVSANLVKCYCRDVEAYVAGIKEDDRNSGDPGCYATSEERQPASASCWRRRW